MQGSALRWCCILGSVKKLNVAQTRHESSEGLSSKARKKPSLSLTKILCREILQLCLRFELMRQSRARGESQRASQLVCGDPWRAMWLTNIDSRNAAFNVVPQASISTSHCTHKRINAYSTSIFPCIQSQSSPRLRQIPVGPRWHCSRPEGDQPKPRLTASPDSSATLDKLAEPHFYVSILSSFTAAECPSLFNCAMDLQRKEYPALLVSCHHAFPPASAHAMCRLPFRPRKLSPSSMIA
jgi:hypothetical protein